MFCDKGTSYNLQFCFFKLEVVKMDCFFIALNRSLAFNALDEYDIYMRREGELELVSHPVLILVSEEVNRANVC